MKILTIKQDSIFATVWVQISDNKKMKFPLFISHDIVLYSHMQHNIWGECDRGSVAAQDDANSEKPYKQ